VTRRAALVPLGVGVLMAVFYVLYAPHTADLAAQTARAELFRNSGYVPFWSGWYAGISTSSYSLVTPPLLGLLGAVGLGVASLLATSVVAGPLVRGARRPLLAGVLLVIAAGLDVISGRATFAAGSAVALLCLLALDRNRPVCSLLLAALATATSPVAGLLVLLAALGVAAADSSRRRSAVTAAAGALAVLAALQLLSIGDGSGYQPFSFLSMLMAVGVAVLVALCPVSARVRAAACVVVVALVAVYFVHSPVGANATRIVVLGAAPAIAGSARLSRRLLVVPVVLASLLPVAQLYNDVHATHHDGSAKSFAAPLVRQLAADPMAADHRVEVVDTATHWPSTYLVPQVSLARGWERQTDESRNPEFYRTEPLTAAAYRGFLDRDAVGLVAVPRGVPLDFGATREADLIARGLPYLQKVWGDRHWTVYDVTHPTPLVSSPGQVVALQDTGVELDVPAPGTYAVRMQWSPYLVVSGGTISGGTVSRSRDGEVSLHLPKPGRYRLHAVWRWP
jgi:hypothetical protein